MLDVRAVPPPWPFSVPVPTSVASVPERQSADVWRVERPPLAEEEPDFADEDFNIVCVTSPPLKVPADRDMEEKCPLTADKPSPVETLSDKEVPVQTLVTLFIREDDEESPKQEELQEEPKKEPMSQTDLNWSDEDKVKITENVISSLQRGEKQPERDDAALMNRYVFSHTLA